MSRAPMTIAIMIVAVVGAILILQPNSTNRIDPPKQEDPQNSVGNITISCKGTARCFNDVVKKIVDGDTLDIGDFRIRLALVNTPERGEEGYAEATKFTSSICPVSSKATVDEDDGQQEGSYGRIVGIVYCSGKNLNEELLETGHAKILTEFCKKSEFAFESWSRPKCT
jgi:endonuclease YncB( thermonuclease family)